MDEDVEHDQEEHEGCSNKLQEIVSDSQDSTFDTQHSSARQQFSQPELNDLVRDLGLSKKAAEVLASRLKEKNLLDSSAKESYF